MREITERRGPDGRPRAPRSSLGYIVGLDLGQASDPTAMAILRRTDSGQKNASGGELPCFDCVHLERFPLGTSYPTIVSQVVAIMARRELHGEAEARYFEDLRIWDREDYQEPLLVLDATGVGRACVDMVIEAGPDATIHPLTITSGDSTRKAPWHDTGVDGYWVAKKHLVSSVQAGLQSGRLRFSAGLALAGTLKRELLAFKVKVSLAGNESFEAWRERDHDDLVLAVAMACWVGSEDHGPSFRIFEYAPGEYPFGRR